MRFASRHDAQPREPRVLTILYVDDLRRSTDFYDAAFGWPKTVDAPTYVEYRVNEGARVGLMHQASSRQFLGDELGARRPQDGCPRGELYVQLDPLDEVVARLDASGAPCPGPRAPRSWGDEAAYYLDPDGYVLAVARPLTPRP